jgi:hypothetical protein
LIGFRLAGIGLGIPNWTVEPPPGMLILAWAGPPFTVTRKLQLALLPAASVAVQVIVVAPAGNADPEGGVHATAEPGRLSETDGGG